MHIKHVDNFSTDIQDILKLARNENSYFISSWDKNDYILNINTDIVKQSICQTEHMNTYIMSKDMENVKKEVLLYLSKQGLEIAVNNMTIVSNGTSAAFISLLQIFKRGAMNFLCIGPIYFTYIRLLDIFSKNLYYYHLNMFEEIKINFNELKKEIIDNNIQCIILIQPFFGSGINLKESILEKLILLCEEQHIFLIIDYVYGNMDWDSTHHINNIRLIQLITHSKFCISYESISKRIFLNGMKSALIFSSPNFIDSINIDSEICLGSISYIQESLLHTIYSPNTVENVNLFVRNALEFANNNYNLLCTLILRSDLQITQSTCGYFTILGIPKKYFSSSSDRAIMNELYDKTGVVTIPHSRYYYNSSKYYCFRINLASDTHDLLTAVKKILHICSNR